MSSPALAQRGVVADNGSDSEPSRKVADFGLCTLGVLGCAGFTTNLPGGFSGDIGGTSYNIDYFSDGPTTTIYIYAEGVVSFGDELPEGATDLASLGTGNWFAPSFGPATEVAVFDDSQTGSEVKYRINWGPGVFAEESTDVSKVRFQLVLDVFMDGPLFVSFGYDSGVPGGYGVGAFNYAPAGGDPGLPPGAIQTSPISAYDLRFAGAGVLEGPVAGGGVPEPGTWALMMLGLGLAGASLRRRSRTWLTAA